ncbi:metallophosphoesterase family protein [Methylopila sp. Yamaguchi]|uniref:metallophosphoesterase family protein n=1 Tax=Methylopila sp. Yamaguchi TaxID=1437817 RepID=UPI000CB7AAD6|nr:DNA repair exonuclease [Methylopila sp. Yamaguchi]GBD50617.1 metallophosphoesterase [Methylopila sp. Yamaguchi]
MASFSFLHAADLHLDSPLIGLSGRSPDFAARVEDASRTALDALVQLAIDEGCRFVLLSGDVFDGDLRNIRAGLFLVSRLARLREAGVRVYMILGNHDAENRFMAKLDFSDNVTLFSARAAHTATLPEIDVAIHGRSFPQRDVTENLAQTYPPPVAGAFNIGLLHTACIGHEGEHAAYAPCSVQQLVNHGYDYWALGHIHDRGLLNERPYVVYPGNLQGRSARETGAKGATLVRVQDGAVESLEHRTLDAVRWAHERVDVGGATTSAEALGRLRDAMERAGEAAEGRPLALRLTLAGETPLHGELALRRAELREEAETIAAGLSAEVWLEKLSLATRAPKATEAAPDPTVAGRIQAEIAALPAEALADKLEARIAEIRARLPASARAEALLEALRAEAPARARALALALVGEGRDDALR